MSELNRHDPNEIPYIQDLRHSLCALVDPTQASDNIHTTFLSYDYKYLFNIMYYIIIRVRSAFSLVMRCVLLKYTHTDDVN